MDRKQELLHQSLQYVIEHGFEDFTLRGIARDLDTNARMLVYHFGSKEALLDAMLAETLRIQRDTLRGWAQIPPQATLRDHLWQFWLWLLDDERVPSLQFTFEVYMVGLRKPESFQEVLVTMQTDWLDVLTPLFADAGLEHSHTRATLTVAVVRGLLLDYLVARERERVDAAFSQFLNQLIGQGA